MASPQGFALQLEPTEAWVASTRCLRSSRSIPSELRGLVWLQVHPETEGHMWTLGITGDTIPEGRVRA